MSTVSDDNGIMLVTLFSSQLSLHQVKALMQLNCILLRKLENIIHPQAQKEDDERGGEVVFCTPGDHYRVTSQPGVLSPNQAPISYFN